MEVVRVWSWFGSILQSSMMIFVMPVSFFIISSTAGMFIKYISRLTRKSYKERR